ncbi:MAG: acyl-CoA ligase (AMP-forming), exosortase A system-associated [Sphingomonadaceae bacterium]
MQNPDPRPRPLDHVVKNGGGNRIALISRDCQLSYSALDCAVGRLAFWLQSYGLNQGDRVATWLPKTVEACLMPLATARAGLIHVPINPLLKRAQVAHIVADSGAAVLIAGAGRAGSLEPGDVPDGCVLLAESEIQSAWQSGPALPLSDHDPSHLAAILYTSGSTGRPKGVMLSHANLWLGAISVAHYLRLDPADRVLALLPLSFDYGQNQLLSAWAAGACVLPLDYLNPRDVVRAVERYAVTTLAGVPPLWVQLVATEWPAAVATHLTRVTNSGGALSVPLIDRLRTTFPVADIYPMYGLTEAFRSTYLDPSLVASHPTSMGSAIPFAEIMVVRSDGSVAADDEAGELVHCGPLVAKGYWQDPQRSAHRFRPAPPASIYGGLAVWSGDTVKRDAERLLYFVGREDEMIKVSGNRISPTEIEDAAQASGAVLESVAFGIADDMTGQKIVLVASPIGHDVDARLSGYLRRELPSFMMPRHVIWHPDLPRNANGKLDRTAIKSEIRL